MQPSPADKTAMRRDLRDRRRAHAAQASSDVARRLVEAVPALLQGCEITPPAIVAAYHALSDEIDPAALLVHLRGLGYRTALPVTQGRDDGLLFRLCDDSTVMQKSTFGVMEPADGEVVSPDVLLVPLLGFDDACQRLGYGAGHYDRTLADMRNDKDVFAAGLAFDMQRIESGLPAEEHDQPLDCVVTEKGLYWPNAIPDLKG